MGLLGNGPDDPRSAAIMALAGGLLQGNFGAGLLGSQQAFSQAKEQGVRNQMLQMQMEQHRMQMEKAKRAEEQERGRYDLMPQFFNPGGPAIGGTADVNAALPPDLRIGAQAPIPARPPKFDVQGYTAAAMNRRLMDPMEALKLQKEFGPKGLEFGKVDPKDYTPESLREAAATGDYTKLVPMRKMDVVNNQAVDLYRAAPGTVFDNNDPNKPFNLRGGQAVPNPAYQNYELSKAKAGASNVSINTGQKGFDNELKLRSDFRSEPIYKAHNEVQSAHSQISAAIKQASPAGDLAAATKIMKILDPGSVVRESELGMAMAATGLEDRIKNYASMVVNGTKLTPNQRRDFQKLADTLYAESAKAYNAKQGEYTGIAKDYGMNPNRVAGPPITSPRLPTAANPQAPLPSLEELLKKY